MESSSPLLVSGFEAAAARPSRGSMHRPPQRSRSLLSASLAQSQSPDSRQFSAFGAIAAQHADSDDCCSSEGSAYGSPTCSDVTSDSASSPMKRTSSAPQPIVVSRLAKERINRATERGAQVERQLEVLHAVRQYLHQRGGIAPAAARGL